jgi:hypothetical protein
MTESRITNLGRKAQSLIQQDPRKAGILGALLLVLAFMIVRYVMSAQRPDVAHGSHAGLRVDDPLTGAVAKEKSAAAASPVMTWLEQPPRPITRNLFALKLELFPPEVTKSEPIQEVRGFWDEIAKSLTDQVDQQEKKQEMLQHLQQQASALQVASVMMGAVPKAIINDKLVGEGDVVAEFRVLKIEAWRIVVEREGIRLEIQMK